jgi:cyanophycin synthetase
MTILETKVMRGPNYWSNYRKNLIQIKLDLQKYEELPTNEIKGFTERLVKLIPSLREHRCSKGYEGGLIERMNEGTWLGHVIEHVALELQCMAGMFVGYGRTRSTGEHGVYYVVFSYILENAGLYAGKAAVELVTAVAENRKFAVKPVIEKLESICRRESFGPSTQSIIDEAAKRGIPATRMDEHSLVMLGQGRQQQLFRATVVGTTSNIGVESAACKWHTKKVLGGAGIPVPRGEKVYDLEDFDAAVEKVGYPLVVKPIDGNHGRGITANIRTFADARKAYKAASQVSDTVIVERYVTGDDYRFLLVDYKLVAVAKRTPAKITGNGLSTVRDLIEEANRDPRRGEGHEKVLTKITIDRQSKILMKEAGVTLDTVLPMGKDLMLKRTANLSTGGTSTDVTDLIHPDNKFMAERIARLMKLDVCGIDVMAHDLTVPMTEENGAIIEVNAGPGFRMHTHPSEGQPRNVAKAVVDMLFPNESSGRIPVVAVTGTNGKTTTSRLIAHLAKTAGKMAGYTSTEGIYIDGHVIAKGDCSGPQSAKMVLNDPSVEYAVLECARGGILRSGLAFDHCDISIVTNVSEDHLGIDGIHTLDDYARVKEVVPRSTFDSGYSILNADDDIVYRMQEELSCNVVLFSMDSTNPRIMMHVANGGKAVVVDNGFVTIVDENEETPVLAVNNIPLTFSGTAEHNIKNILPAVGAAWLSGFDIAEIRSGLLSFVPSPELTPGRMNLFDFGHFRLMLDYAHNEAGFREIAKYVDKVRASRKTCIIGATGDRRDEDIRNLGRNAARIFDEIIIRHDENGRGRTNEEMTRLIMEGILDVSDSRTVQVISDEAEAIAYATSNALPDSFVFVCADNVWNSIELIRSCQAQYAGKMELRAS